MLTTVFGKRGSGKTTLIRAKIAECVRPVIIIDILGNYDPESEEGLRWIKEQPQIKSDTWIVTESHIDALEELLLYMKEPSKHSGVIVVRDSDMNKCVDYLCSALWHKKGGTLVIDEADAVSLKDAPCFDEAIRYGRNKQIDIITGCRRPAEISRNVTAGADMAYCLSTQEPRDIDYYCDFLGEEQAYALKDLPPYHGIYRNFKDQTEGFFKTDIKGTIKILKSVDKNKRPTETVSSDISKSSQTYSK